jgi:small subunit ribosomal protein S2
MNITINDLVDAGVHFGHQLRRFNPKAKRYVYDNRHGISVIDLEQTYTLLDEAATYIEKLVASGKNVLFVGTKRQAQEIIREAATACQMPFCANRWMGGTLTNYSTIKSSLDKYKNYLAMDADGSLDKLHNKEASAIRREMNRMQRNFEGLLEMTELPASIFVIDINHEQIAVAEANRMEVPLIALVDTNSDPNLIDKPIPGNDDSIKSIRVIVETIVEAVQNGLALRETQTKTMGISPIVREFTKEEQLPITAPTDENQTVDQIPTSYSSDVDDDSSSSTPSR